MIHKLALAIALAVASAGAAHAQIFPIPKGPPPGTKSKAGEVLAEFGLIGDFAADCSKTPPGGQGHATYTILPNGTVQNVFNMAANPNGLNASKSEYLFLDAWLASPTEIKIRAFASPLEGEVEVTMIKGTEGYRLVSSLQLGAGKYLIQNSQHRGYTYKWIKNCGVNLVS
jgi:hypothetical protein